MAKKWYSFFVVTGDGQGQPASSAGAAAPAPVRAADLAPETPEPLLDPQAAPVPSTDLALVYESAKIAAPAHGYTVLKVGEMLQSEHLRGLPADVRRKSVLVALDAAGVGIDDIVQDAVRRDRALDTYERVLQQHVDQLAAASAAENRQLEEEVTRRLAELRAQIEQNTRRLSSEQAELQAWRLRKQQEEALIAETVSYFVSENPITTTGSGSQPGDADNDR